MTAEKPETTFAIPAGWPRPRDWRGGTVPVSQGRPPATLSAVASAGLTRRPALASRPAAAPVLLLAGLCLAIALSACGRPPLPAAPKPKPVETAAAVRQDLDVWVTYAARVEAGDEVTIAPRIPGTVTGVHAEIGTRVSPGMVLATLDRRDGEAQYRQAKAAYDSALASLRRTEDSGQGQQVVSADAAAGQAQIQYNDARDFAAKATRLFDQGVISRREYDDAQSRFANAGIALEAARNSQSILKEKSGPQTSSVATAQVDQARAALELAQSRLDDTRLAAPIAGSVSLKNIEVGQMVAAGTPVFAIVSPHTLFAVAGVSESMLASVNPGLPVTMRLQASGDAVVRGVIDSVGPAADPRTQTWQVRIRLENPPPVIRQGMLARVKLPAVRRSAVVTVPNRAIVSDQGLEYVWVAEQSKARRLAVRVGESDGISSEILEGLSPGAAVVVAGQTFLSEGLPVAPAAPAGK